MFPSFFGILPSIRGFLGGASGRNPPANVGDIRDAGSVTGLARSLEEGRSLTQVFLPEESHRQRRVAGDSPGVSRRVEHD